MKIVLQRIRKTQYDSLLETVIEKYKKTGEIIIDPEEVSNSSEIVTCGNNQFEIDFSIEKYEEIVNNSSLLVYEKLSQIGTLLHKELSLCETRIPTNVCYEKEVWAFLSLTVFCPIVLKLRLDELDKNSEDKIRRFLFNSGTISRTGLLFLWVMVDRLESENDIEMTKTAFEFIDPVKAIFERNLSKNHYILKAFVQGIINNGKDRRFKSNRYRVKVPNNISCFAGVNLLDAYKYDELVSVITQQQMEVINS